MIRFIKSTYLYFIFASFGLLVFCFNSSSSGDEGNESRIIEKVKKTLSYMHYAPKSINDDFSEQVYNKFIDNLDPYKRIFTQEDINVLNKSKYLMDDYYNNSNVDFHDITINKLYERIADAEKVVNKVLANPITFDVNEDYILNDEKKSFPKNKAEWEKGWAKFVKFQILNEAYSSTEIEENKTDSIKNKIGGKTLKLDKNYQENTKQTLTKKEVLKKATEKVKENLTDYFRRAKARKKSDYFSIYVNAFAETYDPHTTYFSPKDSEEFSKNISGKFEGIGASIQDKKGYPTILNLIIGGPAWKSKQLESGDKIIKVGQGNKEPINVVGMLLEDAIRLIKGKKGTTVKLIIQKKNGTIDEISIVRDEIEIEESYAKSTIITDKKGDKYGLIYFPSFYMPFNETNGKYVSQDVKRELGDLKKEGIKGVILDIRNNGGGSLKEVVNLVGLFIKTGPVVQVMSSDGSKKILEDEDPSIEWNGPLAIMVNELSASASEILAGAIQDYKRGIIIGSPQTFGKGTVQSVYPLDRFSFNKSDLGDLKLTVQKYYRITGNSVQLKGVTSDIVLPDKYSYIKDFRESAQKNALPWDLINSTTFIAWTPTYDLNKLKTNSAQRLINNTYLKLTSEGSKWLEKISKEEKISLQYDAFFKQRKSQKEESKKYESLTNYKNNLKFSPVEKEKNIMITDTIKKEKVKDWYKNLQKDFYLDEAIKVLQDIK